MCGPSYGNLQSSDNFSKEGSRPTRVTSVTPKLVFFVLAWTAVQQQRFANLVLFQILKVLKTKLVLDLGTKVGINFISTSASKH